MKVEITCMDRYTFRCLPQLYTQFSFCNQVYLITHWYKAFIFKYFYFFTAFL